MLVLPALKGNPVFKSNHQSAVVHVIQKMQEIDIAKRILLLRYKSPMWINQDKVEEKIYEMYCMEYCVDFMKIILKKENRKLLK